ncbi:MAG: hypothetical protein JW770_08095 [Actinobacteria bacterium]|nr:hypothetical protein [Actinomycetota bacterium]
MPNKIAIINYSKCNPPECRDGICNALAYCSKKIIKQEEPYDAPFINPGLCTGCFECLKACRLGAIEKAR